VARAQDGSHLGDSKLARATLPDDPRAVVSGSENGVRTLVRDSGLHRRDTGRPPGSFPCCLASLCFGVREARETIQRPNTAFNRARRHNVFYLAYVDGGAPVNLIVRRRRRHTAGTVPPSMTYSLPLIEAARSETRNATSSATSSGRPGLPIGMPPSESIRP